jgi:hypothetical protein
LAHVTGDLARHATLGAQDLIAVVAECVVRDSRRPR